MASKLYNLLNTIETGRKQCINNAKLANLQTNENMNFTDIANLFLLKNTPTTIHGWNRPSDWWDTQTILEEAEERTNDNDETVYPAYIILLDDSDKQTIFSKTTSNASLQGDSYLTSDGTWYGTTDATHTWDESKDKVCSSGYKTRYVLVYTKTPTSSLTINLRNFPCLEVILGNITCVINCGNSGNPRNEKIQNIVALDNTTLSSNITFQNCSSLASVSLPSATSIYGSAFQNCSSLASVSLPSATTIGSSAFQNCYSLASVSLPNATTIGSSTFYNCFSLASVSLPNVTTIGNSTFYGCYSLASVSLPNATKIESSAFQNCYSLASVSLPNATTIENYVFQTCRSLTSISFPSLTSIGGAGFIGCYLLANITLPDTIVAIPTSNSSFGSYLKSIILPYDFNLDINLTGETSLTHSALVDILDKLKDLTGTEETHTITLGTTNTAKLSSAEIQVATNKGWTVN